MSRLSVNVDHVATLRQARGAGYPDPLEGARIAEEAGAHGITVHLRGDRRHIQDHDVRRLREQVVGKLNLEIAATEEMMGLARDLEPDQVTIVPERENEVTTEGGLDLETHGRSVERAAQTLAATGILVSVFLDPHPEQIQRLAEIPRDLIPGFEINTDRYSRAGGSRTEELERIATCAELGSSRGLQVFAGHGLTTANVGALAALPEIEEFNIGHSIVARAVLVGMERAVQEILSAIRSAGSSTRDGV
jgi:pyridoxine 5-phosphate synthase